MLEKGTRIQGAGFLLDTSHPDDCFTPEDLNEEQRMIAKTAADFAAGEIRPHAEEIDAKDIKTIRELMKKAGELGLNSIDIAEEYGGFALDKTTSGLVVEYMNLGNASFSAVIGAHSGIGTLPIIYFGTPEQKERYLPGIGSGEYIAAYALTEANAGSDALAARTSAVLNPEGTHYILNGEKLFITNGGYADMFIVFAKIDGEHFTAFIVERDFEGVSSGAEEKKLGLKGSSTTTVILEDAKVPVENVLGEIGKGHRVAFNNLNIGRLKLGFATIGGAKVVSKETYNYAIERKQFNKSITEFGMIREKFARMAIEIFVSESAAYRTSGLIDAMIESIPADAENPEEEQIKALEEYAVEASIVKVYCSEMLDMVVDEGLQIHGGYGYTSEYPIEQAFRDARINRIFEGTNEINRLLVPGTVLRRVMKGALPLMNAGVLITADIQNPAGIPTKPGDGPLGRAEFILNLARRAVLYATHTCSMRYMKEIADRQDILAGLAEMMMYLFTMDTAYCRAKKLLDERGEENCEYILDIINTYFHDTRYILEKYGVELLTDAAPEDKLENYITHIKRYLPELPYNVLAAKERIAKVFLDRGEYKI